MENSQLMMEGEHENDLLEAAAAEASETSKIRAALLSRQDDLAEVFARGYDWATAHRAALKVGLVTCGVDIFKKHCLALGLEPLPRSRRKPKKKAAKKSRSGATSAPKSKPKGFSLSRPDEEDLY